MIDTYNEQVYEVGKEATQSGLQTSMILLLSTMTTRISWSSGLKQELAEEEESADFSEAKGVRRISISSFHENAIFTLTG